VSTHSERLPRPVVKRHPGVSRVTVFAALLRRDMRVARRELVFFLLRTTMQPLLFVVVFGYLIPAMGLFRDEYRATLLPGIIAVSLALSAVQSVALPMVQDFGWTREIEDRLLAPIETSWVGMEKMVSGTIQGIVAALFVLPVARGVMGEVPGVTFANVGGLLVVIALGSAVFSALGLWLGSRFETQQIGFLFSLIFAPMLFFGCAYYPWMGLAVVPALQIAVLINPLVYVSEAMRGVMTPGVPHMPLLVAVSALALILALLGVLALRAFHARAIN
jgi:ABC-2 type transport system permease protein